MNGTEEVRVDYASIEKSLAELWRGENREGSEHAVTRAALWNVVAHTWRPADHSEASQTLSRAAASVPQRTIVVRAEPDAPPDIASWISANCHMIGREKQVCSEEVAIVASGDRVQRVPPLVNALLIPDMPVAVWWIGDLPNEHHSYVDRLLEPADRLIVDSSHFDSPDDLALVWRIAEETTTAPADLNWVRLEDWRAATAAIFDPGPMRSRLRRIREVRVCATTSRNTFGDSAESFLYAAWLTQSAETQPSYRFDTDRGRDTGSLSRVDITFEDATTAAIIHDEERNVLTATVDGVTRVMESVTRTLSRSTDNLIVRQLKRADADRVFVRVLPLATELARR